MNMSRSRPVAHATIPFVLLWSVLGGVPAHAVPMVAWEFSGEVIQLDPILSNTFSLGEVGVFRATIPLNAIQQIDGSLDRAVLAPTSTSVAIGDYSVTNTFGRSLVLERDQMRLLASPALGHQVGVMMPGPTLDTRLISVVLTKVEGGFDPNGGLPTNLSVSDLRTAIAGLVFTNPDSSSTRPLVQFRFTRIDVADNGGGTIEWRFSGEVDQVDPLLSAQFSVGQTGVFRAAISATQADADPNPDAAVYRTITTTIRIGDYLAVAPDGSLIQITNNVVRFTSDVAEGPSVTGPPREVTVDPTLISILLRRDSGAVPILHGGLLSPLNLNLPDFRTAAGGLFFTDPGGESTKQPSVRLGFSSLNVRVIDDPVSVPEPSTIVLLVLGMAVVMLRGSVSRPIVGEALSTSGVPHHFFSWQSGSIQSHGRRRPPRPIRTGASRRGIATVKFPWQSKTAQSGARTPRGPASVAWAFSATTKVYN